MGNSKMSESEELEKKVRMAGWRDLTESSLCDSGFDQAFPIQHNLFAGSQERHVSKLLESPIPPRSHASPNLTAAADKPCTHSFYRAQRCPSPLP